MLVPLVLFPHSEGSALLCVNVKAGVLSCKRELKRGLPVWEPAPSCRDDQLPYSGIAQGHTLVNDRSTFNLGLEGSLYSPLISSNTVGLSWCSS